MRRTPLALCLVALLAAGCSGSTGADSGTSSAAAALPPSSGAPLPTAQRVMSAAVRGKERGYKTHLQVIDAQRSLPNPGDGPLLVIRGLGTLYVACSARPKARFVLTTFAAGEGPPVVHTDREPADELNAISIAPGSVAGFTGDLAMQIPQQEAGPHQVLEHVTVSGGGEAFQFTAAVTALLTPTTDRCDTLAQATMVTHGPFLFNATG